MWRLNVLRCFRKLHVPNKEDRGRDTFHVSNLSCKISSSSSEERKDFLWEMFLTTFLSTVEVAALSYERKEKEGGGEEEGETEGG